MIDINLIPVLLRKNGKASANAVTINIPKEVLLGTGVGVVVFLVSIHLLLGVIWMMAYKQLNAKNAQWDAVVPDKAAFDKVNQQVRDLKVKVNMISDMTTKGSVLWAHKFNLISDSLPRGLWIRKMTLDKNGLTMEGSAVSKNQNEINNIGLFLSSLKQNADFMKDFSTLEVNSIQRSKSNTVDVTDFTVMAKLNETRPK